MPPGSSGPRAFFAAGAAAAGAEVGFDAVEVVVVVDCLFDGVLLLPVLFFRFLLLPSKPSNERICRTNSLIDFARVGLPSLVIGSQGVSLCGAKDDIAFL